MGNPFVHVELTADDLGKAKKFYKAVFDWKLKDVNFGPGQIYTTIDVGGGVGGGMQARPMPQAPVGWMAYVGVADVKKTVAKAKKAGAQVFVEYEEVPNMGALAIIADPNGSSLGLWQPFAPPAKATKKVAKKKASKKKASKKR